MIITISGKPCTGKSTLTKILSEKYGFEVIRAGEYFKSIARSMGIDITELSNSNKIIEIDYKVDDELKKVYNTRLNDNLIIESRTAWSFMPKAFNVFLTVSEDVMASRLFNSERSVLERGANIEEAKQKVISRYNGDNARYKKIYNIECDNLNNYTFVLDNSNLTPEESVEIIYKEYKKFII